jgi:ATP adenylyltransferase
MVAPYRHVANYDELTADEYMDLHDLASRCIRMMRKTFQPQGFNLGINMGKVAGAGFDEHVHLHIVPRWNGDTNFMPVISDMRVVPEALHATYEKFLENWE